MLVFESFERHFSERHNDSRVLLEQLRKSLMTFPLMPNGREEHAEAWSEKSLRLLGASNTSAGNLRALSVNSVSAEAYGSQRVAAAKAFLLKGDSCWPLASSHGTALSLILCPGPSLDIETEWDLIEPSAQSCPSARSLDAYDQALVHLVGFESPEMVGSILLHETKAEVRAGAGCR